MRKTVDLVVCKPALLREVNIRELAICDDGGEVAEVEGEYCLENMSPMDDGDRQLDELEVRWEEGGLRIVLSIEGSRPVGEESASLLSARLAFRPEPEVLRSV